MMQPNNKTNYKEWFDMGKRDLEDAELLLDEGRLENAAILLQQSLEKYLKGFLIKKGWELKKTHNLSLLLADAMKYSPQLRNFENICKKAGAYYFEDRYPGFRKEPNISELKSEFNHAKELINILIRANSRKVK